MHCCHANERMLYVDWSDKVKIKGSAKLYSNRNCINPASGHNLSLTFNIRKEKYTERLRYQDSILSLPFSVLIKHCISCLASFEESWGAV
jgi:hypothetical protein